MASSKLAQSRTASYSALYLLHLQSEVLVASHGDGLDDGVYTGSSFEHKSGENPETRFASARARLVSRDIMPEEVKFAQNPSDSKCLKAGRDSSPKAAHFISLKLLRSGLPAPCRKTRADNL